MASTDKGRRVGYPPDADLRNHAYDDLAALVAEVERLRAAIDGHRKARTEHDNHIWESDEELWNQIEQ